MRATIFPAAACALLLASAASAHSSPRRLVGEVGRNEAYRISLAQPGGATVTRLRPGTYVFVIHDYSAFHDFELEGPGGKTRQLTSVEFKGTKVVALKLVAGSYKAYCKPHATQMLQRFSVA